jgi:hypothetical protein
MSESARGSCLCGAVTYSVTAELNALSHCHCTQCQKGHGAAFATYANAPRAAVAISDPKHVLKSYASSPGVARQFCSECGSSLFWSNANGTHPDWISIALGTVDTPVAPPQQKHLWVESKAPWCP